MDYRNKYLAIIPARGNSKRLPRKNILSFAGKPLLQWSIEAALQCDFISKTVVSSDCPEILSISRLPGVDLHERPKTLALDESSSVDVVLDVLKNYEKFSYIVLLQPTSPLRCSADISDAIKCFERSWPLNSLISVCETDYNPILTNTLRKNKKMKNFFNKMQKDDKPLNSQKHYRINGAIYIISTDIFLENRSFLNEETIAFIMKKEKSIDIDSKLDFEIAEFLKFNTVG